MRGRILLLSVPLALSAHEVVELEKVRVVGRSYELLGEALSASQGFVGRHELRLRPILREAELVEVIPGMVATQHSGSGKANQYFLRGFNLDHGTDFAAFLDGVPLNLPSHGHGQGWLDLNFLIPELIDYVEFGKGPYYADVGDFSSAGYARFRTVDHLHRGFLKATFGSDSYYRVLGADSWEMGGGYLLAAAEFNYYNGPWTVDQDMEKVKGFLKYTVAGEGWGSSLSLLAYYNDWTANDQIPERALRQKILGYFDTVDPTNGGRMRRFGATWNLWHEGHLGSFGATLFGYYSDLDLYSNFTFFLENPLLGDQIYQKDRRLVSGISLNWSKGFELPGGIGTQFSAGAQLRHDWIPTLQLGKSFRRNIYRIVRSDEVQETALGFYAQNRTSWTTWLRTSVGLRGDVFRFDVEDRRHHRLNSGDRSDFLVSPKFGLVLGPFYETELYFNQGFSFHSNDARGVVSKVDPTTGEPIRRVDPLVRSRGIEFGLRSHLIPGWVTTLAFWRLKLDSELVWAGDAGTTEPQGKSKREGIEWSNFYTPPFLPWVTLDFDLALSRARFEDTPLDNVPNSVGRVLTAGIAFDHPSGLFGSMRFRHFGAIPLNEKGTVEADSTTIVNLLLGYRWQDRVKLDLQILNLFDSRDPEIMYFYPSRLPGEPPEGVEDRVFRVFLPRQFRGTVTVYF